MPVLFYRRQYDHTQQRTRSRLQIPEAESNKLLGDDSWHIACSLHPWSPDLDAYGKICEAGKDQYTTEYDSTSRQIQMQPTIHRLPAQETSTLDEKYLLYFKSTRFTVYFTFCELIDEWIPRQFEVRRGSATSLETRSSISAQLSRHPPAFFVPV